MPMLRVCLLVLLALLIPVRGVVAAVALCARDAGPPPAIVAASAGHHDHHGQPDARVHHADAGQQAGHAEPAAEASNGNGCHTCASACCMSALPTSLPAVAAPLPGGEVSYPALSAPVSAFQSDGQDRPPRIV